jgi:hypothetical protein
MPGLKLDEAPGGEQTTESMEIQREQSTEIQTLFQEEGRTYE